MGKKNKKRSAANKKEAEQNNVSFCIKIFTAIGFVLLIVNVLFFGNCGYFGASLGVGSLFIVIFLWAAHHNLKQEHKKDRTMCKKHVWTRLNAGLWFTNTFYQTLLLGNACIINYIIMLISAIIFFICACSMSDLEENKKYKQNFTRTECKTIYYCVITASAFIGQIFLTINPNNDIDTCLTLITSAFLLGAAIVDVPFNKFKTKK